MPVTLEIPRSELIEVSHSRIVAIVDSALPYYRDDGTMLAHGPDHAIATTNTFMKDWVLCAEHNCAPDFEAGVGAAAHHDDSSHLPLPDDSEFNSVEERSVAIAIPELIKLDFSNAQIPLTEGGILATHAGTKCTNLLDIMEVRADLINVQNPFTFFLRTFVYISKEKRRLGIIETFNEARDLAIQKLSAYFDQDLRYPFEDRCHLVARGLHNLGLLEKTTESDIPNIIGESFHDD